MAPPRSLDRDGVPETLVESTPKSTLQSRLVGQLKSCLNKVDELGNNTLKETAHVTFQLDNEELSPIVVTTMDEYSQKECSNVHLQERVTLKD